MLPVASCIYFGRNTELVAHERSSSGPPSHGTQVTGCTLDAATGDCH